MALGPEDRLQIDVVKTLRTVILPPGRVLRIGNGSHLSTAARRKIAIALGEWPGASDLLLTWVPLPAALGDMPRLQIGGIELKRPTVKGKTKPVIADNQTEFAAWLTSIGAFASFEDSLEGVLATVKAWGVPMRPIRILPSGATLMGMANR